MPLPHRNGLSFSHATATMAAVFLMLGHFALAQTVYTVTLATDTNPPQNGELRNAMLLADGDGTDSIIQFTLPPGTTITLNAALGPLLIATENRTWVQGPGAPLLQIDANGQTQAFLITTSGNCISDLSIFNAQLHQILINGTLAPAQTNWVYGCYIGLNSLGLPAGTNQIGVGIIGANAAYNLVGTDGVPMSPGVGGTPGLCAEPGAPPVNIATGAGTDALERNYISNNNNFVITQPCGVYIATNAFSNRVAGNFIGTNLAGTQPIPNGEGVLIDVALENYVGISDVNPPINYIGNGEADEWNLISGNNQNGVLIDAGQSNWVAGNIIGPDVSGTTLLVGVNASNLWHGVWVTIGSTSNIIGTDGDGFADIVPGAPTGGERNVISGNIFNGVLIDAGSQFNWVSGNYIGVDITGAAPLGNTLNGVELDTAPHNLVGTNADGSVDALETNVISGNGQHGIFIASSQDLVWGNIIGLDASEATIPGNVGNGILLSGASSCSIGLDIANIGAGYFVSPPPPPPGPVPAQANVISENGIDGIRLTGTTCTGNYIVGNWIGTDSSATVALGNLANGVRFENGAHDNFLGIIANFIWHNAANGVFVDDTGGAGTIANLISQNSINNNGLLGIENFNGGNIELAPPTITSANIGAGTVSGTSTAPDSSVIEVFYDDAEEGIGFLATTTVTGGNWTVSSVTFPSLTTFYVTATVTDTANNTSEFDQFGPTNVDEWQLLND